MTRITCISVTNAPETNTAKVIIFCGYDSVDSKQLLRTKALKRYLILTAPNYLLINLKRFTQSGFAFSKNSKRISFPSYLFMDDFMIHKVHF